MKNLKLISAILMILGAAAGLGQSFVDDKRQEKFIEERINEALAEKSNESDEESV